VSWRSALLYLKIGGDALTRFMATTDHAGNHGQDHGKHRTAGQGDRDADASGGITPLTAEATVRAMAIPTV
jgi:hypothetical protein